MNLHWHFSLRLLSSRGNQEVIGTRVPAVSVSRKTSYPPSDPALLSPQLFGRIPLDRPRNSWGDEEEIWRPVLWYFMADVNCFRDEERRYTSVPKACEHRIRWAMTADRQGRVVPRTLRRVRVLTLVLGVRWHVAAAAVTAAVWGSEGRAAQSESDDSSTRSARDSATRGIGLKGSRHPPPTLLPRTAYFDTFPSLPSSSTTPTGTLIFAFCTYYQDDTLLV